MGTVTAISSKQQAKNRSFCSVPPFDVSKRLDFDSNLNELELKKPNGSLRQLLLFELFLGLGIVGMWALFHLAG